jgi:hypothetical protein
MNNTAILVLSCDKYSDLWDGFFHQLKKNFITSAPIYLVSNFRTYKNPLFPGLKVIQNGGDTNWSDGLKKVLDQIPERSVFILLEDIYIDSEVLLERYERLLNWFNQGEIQHLKYMGSPPAQAYIRDDLYQYQIGMPYLVSACGLWNKNYLLSLLVSGENAWEFEINASYRAKYSAHSFFGLNPPLFTYKNMVEKGGWIKNSIDWAISESIPIDPSGRGLRNNLIYRIKKEYFELIIQIPWQWRLKLINVAKKLLITY